MVTPEEEIAQVQIGKPHVFLLGAGASRAALPDGDANGKKLPVMADFLEIVPVAPILDRAGVEYGGRNFEEVYGDLCTDPDRADVRAELDQEVFEYFHRLELPPEPTIYDLLFVALRPKDVIATFNWDPFLLQAEERTREIRGEGAPYLPFLHGNVAAGYCPSDNVHGRADFICNRCGEPFDSSKILYPIFEKDYDSSPEIADTWRAMKAFLGHAFMLTIFGYGAPSSDAAAVRLLQEGWGPADTRPHEQIEIIDIRSRDDLESDWATFTFSHHYEVFGRIWDSWVFNHPRRTGEAWWNQYMDARWIDNNPVPRSPTWAELEEWIQPLLEAEAAAK